MKKSVGGFSVVEVIIGILILGIIGFVAWRVYDAYMPAPTKTAAPSSSQTEQPVDPTADWKKYTSKAGKYTLKYPVAWRAKACENSGPDLYLTLDPTSTSGVKCGDTYNAQMLIVSTAAVPTASEQELGAFFASKKKQSVTVDGVKGFREEGKLRVAKEGYADTPLGTKVVTYFFLKPGRSYIAAYIQQPSGKYTQDHLAEFDLMVTKTWDFTK